MSIDKRKHIFIRCCYGYFVSGMAVLVIGAILPSIIAEAGISFMAAGGLLSAMAVGNLICSFVFPVLVSFLKRRGAITLLTALTPLCLLGLSLLPPLPVMYGLMLLYGLIRGAVTINNNSDVSDIYEKEASGKLNLLHCSFAVGAFLAPFLTALMMEAGFGWKSVIYLLAVLTATSAISYGTMDDRLLESRAEILNRRSGSRQEGQQADLPGNITFFKSFQFYCISFLLFFYLGVENCINGWFVTYLQNTGVMSAAYATALVSVTWLVIMVGRLFCAALSKRMAHSSIILMNAAGSAICFFILISTKSLPVITVALLGFGFFLAGIYPTSIANVSPLIHGSTLGMAALTAISAVGGIVTPQLVGGVADRVGIVAAIGILVINVAVVVLLAVINRKKYHS